MPAELPKRVEAGTPNLPGVTGLCEGLRFVQAHTDLLRHEQDLLRRFRGRIPAGLAIAREPQADVLSLRLPVDCEAVGQLLGEAGVAVRAGLHCAPLAHESAGTLTDGTLRVSPDAFTSPEDMDAAADSLRLIMNKLSNL